MTTRLLYFILILLFMANSRADLDTDMHFRDNPLSDLTAKTSTSTADHSKFEILQQDFTSGPEVTKACLSCHTEAGQHVMQSIHWTWEYNHPTTGQKLGKKTLINAFCTNARGNEGMCAQCHAGYGWADDSFDFTKQENIDCLVCHDRSGKYYKTPNSAGNEACSVMFKDKEPIPWDIVAQNVGQPGRENCGACHFYGGGGDGVKHGDLDSSLEKPNRDLDVHMDVNGLNFSCSECHVSDKHIWSGSRYNIAIHDDNTRRLGQRNDVATCESCHTANPHQVDFLQADFADNIVNLKLNDHVNKVACQTCHIPTIARGGVATKVFWDWRTAGKTINGEGYKESNYVQGDGKARATYKSIKGDFVWDENLVPNYAWFNGQMLYTTIDTVFDFTQSPIEINGFKGQASDPNSRIWPFKLMHTVQPYDKGNNTLVYMHLWGDDKDAYWGNYDFARAIEVGMRKHNIPYSGQYDFIDTHSYWPITHMVAPKEQALDCGDCHSQQGRLANVTGFYLPGRDSHPLLDKLGLLLIIGVVGGILFHIMLRLITRRAH